MEQNNCFEKSDQRDVVFICAPVSLYTYSRRRVFCDWKKKTFLTEHKQLTFIKMMMVPRYRDVQNFGMRPSFSLCSHCARAHGSSARNGRFLRNLSHCHQWHQEEERYKRGWGNVSGIWNIVIERPRLAGVARRRSIKSPVCRAKRALMREPVYDSLTDLRMYTEAQRWGPSSFLPLAIQLPLRAPNDSLSTEKNHQGRRISRRRYISAHICAHTMHACNRCLTVRSHDGEVGGDAASS